jgi:metal transporter CNNM
VVVCFVLQTLYDIFKSGYSRIPVYDRDRNDVVGLILAKDLIFIDPEVSHSKL